MNYSNINHPFFIYPRGFMSEYNEYKHYRNEVLRLFNFIDDLSDEIEKMHKDILIPFIIGSSMEDALAKSNTSEENYFQFRQLFPNYIHNFIQNNLEKKFIQIIIISPDSIFSEQSNIKPRFILHEEMEFIETNKNEYIYANEQINIRINIFNCMIPCIENRNGIISRYENAIKSLSYEHYGITSYIQTSDDLNFINEFYSRLDKLFNFNINQNHNVKIIVNSWVSFKNLDGYSEMYNMFPKILELANKYKIIATEWKFVDELFYTKIISEYKFENKDFFGCYIDYVFDNDLINPMNLPKNIIKKNFTLCNLFVIDFNSHNLLTKSNLV